jgi:cation transport regulator
MSRPLIFCFDLPDASAGPESAMPYVTVEDLPDSVRDHLPPHAQEIYLAAFNKAWRQHAGDPDIEPTVHRIAWSAVKRRYRKAGDEWVPITR